MVSIKVTGKKHPWAREYGIFSKINWFNGATKSARMTCSELVGPFLFNSLLATGSIEKQQWIELKTYNEWHNGSRKHMSFLGNHHGFPSFKYTVNFYGSEREEKAPVDDLNVILIRAASQRLFSIPLQGPCVLAFGKLIGKWNSTKSTSNIVSYCCAQLRNIPPGSNKECKEFQEIERKADENKTKPYVRLNRSPKNRSIS